MPTLADSLAGRMGMLRLHPLAQCEIEGKRPRFIEKLFRAGFKTGIADRLGSGLAERISESGYPAALARRAPGGAPSIATTWRRRSSATCGT